MVNKNIAAHNVASILVVEDNADLMETLSFTLQKGGCIVSKAQSAKQAFHLLDNTSFDLILLDIMLPDESGFELCRMIKEKKHTKEIPVVFLSAKSEEIDKVVGFEVGADDYITKPFSVKELLLRINAILRRVKSNKDDHEKILFGLLSVDFHIPKILVDNTEVYLTSLELRLLKLLYQRKGRVQTRSQLLDAVWNIEADVTTRTVDTHIKRLREKLTPASDYIKTIRGIGYRFITKDEL